MLTFSIFFIEFLLNFSATTQDPRIPLNKTLSDIATNLTNFESQTSTCSWNQTEVDDFKNKTKVLEQLVTQLQNNLLSVDINVIQAQLASIQSELQELILNCSLSRAQTTTTPAPTSNIQTS